MHGGANVMNSSNVLTWLFLAGCLLTVGDICQKESTLRHSTILFIAGICIWTLSTVILAYSYAFRNMAVATLLYVIFNILTLLIISWLWYNEPLNIKSLLGMTMGLLAIYLLES